MPDTLTPVPVAPRIASGVAARLQQLGQLQREIALIVDTVAESAGIVEGAVLRSVDTDTNALLFEIIPPIPADA